MNFSMFFLALMTLLSIAGSWLTVKYSKKLNGFYPVFCLSSVFGGLFWIKSGAQVRGIISGSSLKVQS